MSIPSRCLLETAKKQKKCPPVGRSVEELKRLDEQSKHANLMHRLDNICIKCGYFCSEDENVEDIMFDPWICKKCADKKK